MSRRKQGLRRIGLTTLYLALLISWAGLSYNTYGVWLNRQEAVANHLEAAAARITSLMTPTPQSIPTPTVVEVRSASAEATPLPPLPTPAPPPIKHPKSGHYIAAWLPTSFDADGARASFEANKAIIDEVSPFWYRPNTKTGALIPELGARDRSLIASAHQANVLVLPTIHNVLDPLAAIPLMRDPHLRKQHIEAIMHEVHTYAFDGIDLDYELLPHSARDIYTTFVRELSAALHADGKLLTVAVHAKSTDEGGLGAFQDWTVLGQVCDRIRIMTYDFHWLGGEAGPIAPLNWVMGVAEYAHVVIPASKIQLGIPFYAYNWAEGEDAIPQTWTDVQELIQTKGVSVNTLEENAGQPIGESYFNYREKGKMRTVWFPSSRSLQGKLNFVEQQDLGGIAIWRLGNEDPRNWQVIRKQFVEDSASFQRALETYLPDH